MSVAEYIYIYIYIQNFIKFHRFGYISSNNNLNLIIELFKTETSSHFI